MTHIKWLYWTATHCHNWSSSMPVAWKKIIATEKLCSVSYNFNALIYALSGFSLLVGIAVIDYGYFTYQKWETVRLYHLWSIEEHTPWILVCSQLYLVCFLCYCMCSEPYWYQSSYQVLPRENGMRYPWNFLFQKCFWRKNNFVKHHGSSLESNFNDELSNERASFLGNNTHEPAVEAISLDMKQQELDKRYSLNTKLSLFALDNEYSPYIFFVQFLDASRLGICVRCMLLKGETVVLSILCSLPYMKIRFLLF